MATDNLIRMLNAGLALEHAARIQYLAHAELVKGPGAEPIIARLKEIAGDEEKHEGLFRECIAILGGEPSMKLAPVFEAKEVPQILKVNLKGEKDAIDFYNTVYEELKNCKAELKYQFEYVEHRVRHVIMDEQEHTFELETLMGK